jgi:hypothetical protein
VLEHGGRERNLNPTQPQATSGKVYRRQSSVHRLKLWLCLLRNQQELTLSGQLVVAKRVALRETLSLVSSHRNASGGTIIGIYVQERWIEQQYNLCKDRGQAQAPGSIGAAQDSKSQCEAFSRRTDKHRLPSVAP